MSQDNEKYHSFQQQDRGSTTQEGNKQEYKPAFYVWNSLGGFSKLLQALPKELNRFGSHNLDKATEFIPEILSSSQISHHIPLNHCKLLSKAFTVKEGWSPSRLTAMLKTCRIYLQVMLSS